MTKLFQNFNDYDINDWKENIIEEFGKEAFLFYCNLNAFKYLWRMHDKDSVE